MSDNLPEGWKWVTLKDVSLNYLNGGTPSTKNLDYWGGEIHWTTSANLSGYYLDSGEKRITKEGLEHSSTNLIPKGNIIVATRVGLGKISINRIDIAISQDLTGIILDKEKVLPEYLAHYLKSDKVLKKIKNSAQGTTIKGINRDALEKLPVLLPPLAEQRRIAEILSAADSAIEDAGKAVFESQQIKTGLMQRLIPRDTENLPEGWRITSISEGIELFSGQHISAEDYSNDPNNGIAYLTGPDDFYCGKISTTKYTTKPKTICEKDDVLVTVKGSGTGKVVIADQKYCISRQLMAIRSSVWDSTYLYYLLITKFGEIKGKAAGLIPGVTRNDILKMELSIPPLPEQQRIAGILSAADQQIALCQKRKALLQQTKTGLMQNLLRGSAS